MPESTYYPPLSSLITLDDLPEGLQFLREALGSLFGSIFYKDYQSSVSADGESVYHRLVLLPPEQGLMELDVPGDVFTVRVTAPSTGGEEGIDCSVSFVWPIKRFLPDFDFSAFANAVGSFERVLAQAVTATGAEFIGAVLEEFYADPITSQAITDLVADLNQNLSIPGGNSLDDPTSGTIEEKVADIANQIATNSYLLDQRLDVRRALYEGVLESQGDVPGAVALLYARWIGRDPMAFVQDLLVPRVYATLGVGLALEFAEGVLTRVDETTLEPLSEPATVTSDVGTLVFGTQTGISFEDGVSLSLPLSQIGSAPFYIQITNATLDLSPTSNVVAAGAYGLPPSFIGVYVKQAVIRFPRFWESDPSGNDTASLVAENMLIGTGGVTGRIAMTADGEDEPLINLLLGGEFGLTLKAFSLDFYQNRITGSSVRGILTIPGIFGGDPATVDIGVVITDNGFEMTGYPANLVLGCTNPNAVNCISYTVDSLSIGSSSGRFFIQTSGRLKIRTDLPVIGNLINQELEIKRLRVWSDGSIDFDGGSLVLPTSVSINAGPIEISVTAVHLGSYTGYVNGQPRQYKYIGFDGGIKSGPGGVDARGNGIKYYFTDDGGTFDHFLKIAGIEIDIIIPGGARPADATVIIEGFLSLSNPAEEPGPNPDPSDFNSAEEYAGGVTITLPKLEMGGGASMRLRPATGDFLVDMFFEMSSPIPLGATGLGIYGFRGLIGSGYVAQKDEGETWWEYYREPKRGIDQSKFRLEDGFSLGAGISLATAADSGRAFSSKLFFLASIPRLFLLEGQANILSKRIGLDTTVDPPFYAAILISDESFEAGFGVDYRLPEGGEILDLDANLELAFFYSRASAWYLNIGRDTPNEKRVRAKVLSLIDMYSYLMLSSQGIKAGAGASWDFQKDFSIAKIAFGVAVDVGGQLSFKPVQIGGFVSIVGYASLRVFGIGFHINVSAKLTAEAPKPFIITGAFRVELGLPWPLPDIKATLSFTWRGNSELNLAEIGMIETPKYDPVALGPTAEDRVKYYLAQGKRSAQGTHMVTGERIPINYVNRDHTGQTDSSVIPLPGDNASGSGWIAPFDFFVIPIDTYIDIEFAKGIRYEPSSAVNPGNYPSTIAPITPEHISTELIPPRKGKSPQVKHEYIVTDVRIKYWKPLSRGSTDENQGSWEDYRLEQMDTTLLQIAGANLPQTSWESLSPETILRDHAKLGFWQMTDGKFYTKLRVLSRTPLEHAVKISPFDADVPSTLFLCPPDPIPMQCQDWTDQIALIYPASVRVSDRKLEFRIVSQDGTVLDFPNVFDITPSLALGTRNRIEIWFPEPTVRVHLKLSTLAEDVTISYYRGYPWTPPPPEPEGESGGGGNEDLIDTWDIEQDVAAVPTNADSIWTKLRNMPAWYRDACGSGLDIQSPAGAEIIGLLAQFRQTHIYLRQTLGLSEATFALDHLFLNAGQWRTEFFEVLEALISGYTGASEISAFLLPNVEQFYADMGRLIEDYRRTVGTGTPPNQDADEFYEKWSGLLEAVGCLYDGRDSLPSNVPGAMWRTLEPEIWRLYDFALARIGTGPNKFDLDVNPAFGRWSTRERLLSASGFFAALSLDFALIVDNEADDVFIDHYLGTERAYLALIRLLSEKEIAALRGSPDCEYAQKIVRISNLFCTGTPDPNVSGAVDRIEALIDDFDPALSSLIACFGWEYPLPPTPDLCTKLRRALAGVAIAFSSYGSVPFVLRYQLNRFYSALNDEVLEYLRDTREVTLPEPDQTTDEFVQAALETFGCLRCICRTSQDTSGVESYLANAIDPELSVVTGSVADRLYDVVDTNGSPVTPAGGVVLPEDPADQAAILFAFFMGAFGRCGTLGALDDTLMSDLFNEFNTEYSTYTLFLSTGGYRHCYLTGGTFAYTWLRTFDPLTELWSRRSELFGTVYEHIDDVIRPIVGDIYTIICTDPNAGCTSMSPDWESLHWQLHTIRKYLRTSALQGGDTDSGIQTALASLLADLTIEVNTLKDIPEFADVDIWGTHQLDLPGVIENAIRAFTDIKLAQPFPMGLNWPSAGLKSLVNDFLNDLNGLTFALGIDAVPLSGLGNDYAAVLGEVLRVLFLAHGSLEQLSIGQAAKVRKFLEELWDEYLAFFSSSPPIPAGSCVDITRTWVDALLCLTRSRHFRGVIQSVDDEFTTRFVDTGMLRTMAGKILVIADRASMDVVPGRSISSRCDRAKLLLNFFTVSGLKYGDITTNWLNDVFANRQALFDAFDGTELESVRENVCFPVPGPYDPLMKRETKARFDLLSTIEYDDPSKPIDRIVIEPNVACDENPPPGWLDTYWNNVRTHVANTLVPQLTADKAAAQSARDALGPKASSEEAIELEERIGALQDDLDNAAAFLATIVVNPAYQFDPCTSYVHEVCWLPPQAYNYNLGLPKMNDVRTSVHGMDISMNLMTQILWRPNTTYAVHIETLERVQGTEYRRYHTFGFRTAGPIGHFHDTGTPGNPDYRDDYRKLLEENRPEAYKYADLRHYVDYRRSYPSPDGNIVGAKPLYFNEPRLQLYYTQDYLRSMFSQWKWEVDWLQQQSPLNAVYTRLELVIIDPASGAEVHRRELSWSDDPDPRQVETTRKFTNIVKNMQQAGKACVVVTPVETPPSQASGTPLNDPLPDLAPGTLYTASIQVRFGELTYNAQGELDTSNPETIGVVREVHRFVFRTSRFNGFGEHIGGYVLSAEPGVEKYAIYPVNVDPVDITVARESLDDLQPDLNRDYALVYDRVVQGALGLADLPAAETTEFSVLRDSVTGVAVAILVRSPEPINDPRLPLEELEKGLKGTNPSDNLKVYFSKDAASALVTREDLSLPTGPISLTFKYRLYDGKIYDTVKMSSGAYVPDVVVEIPTP